MLSSLFDALTASAAQQPPRDATARWEPLSSATSAPARRLLCAGGSVSIGATESLTRLLCPQRVDSGGDCVADVCVGRGRPSSDAALQRVWPPHRSSLLRVSAECFSLPAAPSAFLQLPAFSRHSAALTGLSDCVHSSAWGGQWLWSSVDGGLHSHQHTPPGWSSARLPPRAVRPLSSWADFHRGSTQRSIHTVSGQERAQQQPTAIAAGAAVDRTRLFPFDRPAAVSTSQTELDTAAPVIGVRVCDAATAEQERSQRAGDDTQSERSATAAPYNVQADTGQQPTYNKSDSRPAAEQADAAVRPRPASTHATSLLRPAGCRTQHSQHQQLKSSLAAMQVVSAVLLSLSTAVPAASCVVR